MCRAGALRRAYRSNPYTRVSPGMTVMRSRVVIPPWLLEGAVRPPQAYVVLWRASPAQDAAPLGTVVAPTRSAALTAARLRWPAAARRRSFTARVCVVAARCDVAVNA